MESSGSDWASRAKARLNRVVERIATFEQRGGVGGAVQRTVTWVRAEQERLRQEVGSQGPMAHLNEVRRAYARLEVPFGSDLITVRRSYRQLMRRYHPDRHAADPERERVATEISQKLTVSYNLLVDYLGR
jgi:DnaJ-domain-containing protein 1